MHSRAGTFRDSPEYKAAFRAAQIAYALGNSVRESRERLGWTQADLAAKAGMKQSAVSRFEAGDAIPTVQTLIRIADALGMRLGIRFVSAGQGES